MITSVLASGGISREKSIRGRGRGCASSVTSQLVRATPRELAEKTRTSAAGPMIQP